MFARQGSVPSSFPGTRAKMNTKFIHPSRHQGPSPARDSYEALYILPLPTNLQCWAAGRARAPRAVLDVLVLDLALVVVVVWEEYQGKQLACPLLRRPGGAA